jgi:hypothetical protein
LTIYRLLTICAQYVRMEYFFIISPVVKLYSPLLHSIILEGVSC